MASKAYDTRPKTLSTQTSRKSDLHGNMAPSDGIAGVQKYEVWYDLFKKNCLKEGGRKKCIQAGVLQRI